MPELAPIAPHLQAGSRLRHYKGGLYTVVGACLIEATLETGVLYQACQGDATLLWMRPLKAFDELVDTPTGPVPRFVPVATDFQS
jgi:hypothetical protein